MGDASQFPITEGFGCQPGYPLNTNVCPPGQGYHNGIDYGCPAGTPVVVNGVTIGLSGATGYVTGPHLHVGRWVNGTASNPSAGGGFHFNSAQVTEVGQDATNGKFVRIQGDGASWVYLHLSQQLVSVGQTLRKGDDSMTAQEATAILDAFFGRLTGRKIKQSELDEYVPVLLSGYPDKFFAKAAEFKEIKDYLGSADLNKDSVINYLKSNLKE